MVDINGDKMNGTRRVIIFCLLTAVVPFILIIIPLYLRNIKYADVMYKVSDSDIIQIHQGQSSLFCERHSLKMNTSFNAFQMTGWPEVSNEKKHIHLKKSMTLPDDTLEYWGFYLLKGATVELKACSRYVGSKILVVRGDKVLDTCHILENNKNKIHTELANQDQVVVRLETPENFKKISKVYESNVDDNTAQEIITDSVDIEDLMKEEKEQLKLNKTDSNSSATSSNSDIKANIERKYKRDTKKQSIHNPKTVLDTGVNHGGNAFNISGRNIEDSSASSFENSLHECYGKNIFIHEAFPHSLLCKSTKYLEKTTTLKVIHQVSADGYYYYIFYSDNDVVQNDIHAIFDIYKPTYQYAGLPKSKMCINSTDCVFDISFLSMESVIVEVPTKDGIEYEEDDSSILISVCHPRTSVYIFFPVTVLLIILLFGFL